MRDRRKISSLVFQWKKNVPRPLDSHRSLSHFGNKTDDDFHKEGSFKFGDQIISSLNIHTLRFDNVTQSTLILSVMEIKVRRRGSERLEPSPSLSRYITNDQVSYITQDRRRYHLEDSPERCPRYTVRKKNKHLKDKRFGYIVILNEVCRTRGNLDDLLFPVARLDGRVIGCGRPLGTKSTPKCD